MISIRIPDEDLNAFLARVNGCALKYIHGCLEGSVRLPVGTVRLVGVPSQRGDSIVIVLPFCTLEADHLGGLLRHLARLCWSPLHDYMRTRVDELLDRAGLPRDTVDIRQERDEGGEEVGIVQISLPRINALLARRQGNLPWTPRVETVRFERTEVSLGVALMEP